MGDCINCTWYEEGFCHNPDCYFDYEWKKTIETGNYMAVEPDDSCTLWGEG